MLRTILHVLLLAPLTTLAAQQQPPQPEIKKDGMQVHINVMNVCTPSDEEQRGIAAALQRVPQKPHFGMDFEVSRGRSTFPDAPPSTWARMRREFLPDSALTNVQYSMSVDEKALIETLVFRTRDPKDVLSVTIEDRMAAVTTPAAALGNDTPASRVKVERFGKSSLGLSRCEQADQSAYEPLFAMASKVLAEYRAALNVRSTIPAELARAGAAANPAPKQSPKRKPAK